ncbi:hypothetical protein BGZ92_011203 [Podila epicladia]|nr:hypothetical protein BGZ92_011203 [Podila epicladia]
MTEYPYELRRGCADAVCVKGGGDPMLAEDILFPVIIKRSLDVQSDNLVEDYNRDSQRGAIGPAAMALRHLFACMRLNGYRYGILSTVAQSWFVKRTSRGLDDICVSPAIKVDQKPPTLLQHYLWFIRQAFTDSWELDPPATQFVTSWIEESIQDMGVSSRTRSKTTIKSTPVTSTTILPVFDMSNQLWSTDSSFAYKIHTPELGNVVLKKCDFMNGSQAAELMKHEIQVYRHLQPLQGVFIPRLHIGGLADGLEFVLVTEYVGKTIEELKLTFEDGETIIKCLAALHGAGVLHGNIRPENITRLHGDNGMYEFRFIDFGFSKIGAKRWEYRREMVDLARMLEAQLDPEVDNEDRMK